MADIIEVHEGGELRRLGLMEQPLASLKSSWQVQAGPDGKPDPIPLTDWTPTDLSVGVRAVNDQDGVGMCASAGTQNTIEIARSLAGLPYVPLSAGDLYRRVCGGSDNGSLPEDNLTELMTNGIAPVSDCPYLEWRRNMPSQSRGKYKGLEAWLCPTALHVGTAVQLGFPVLIGYWHHNSDPVGADGWMRQPSGGKGGHAVCVVGVVKDAAGNWGFKFENSWTRQWGKDGFGILPLARVEEGCRSFQAWSLRAVSDDGAGFPAPTGG